jgi:hypothetical protein
MVVLCSTSRSSNYGRKFLELYRKPEFLDHNFWDTMYINQKNIWQTIKIIPVLDLGPGPSRQEFNFTPGGGGQFPALANILFTPSPGRRLRICGGGVQLGIL